MPRSPLPARTAALAAGALALLAGAPAARAHQASFTYSDLRVSDDRLEVAYRLRIATRDLYEALALDTDRDATDAEIAGGGDRLYKYVLEGIELGDGKTPCQPRPGAVKVVEDNGRFAELTWTYRCPAPLALLVVDYDLFFELDNNHLGLMAVSYAGRQASAQLTADDIRFEWDLGGAPPSHLGAFVRGGIHHIFTGYDHIAFLIGLLLIAVVAGAPGAWRLRGLGAGLRYTLAIVSSFTLAHSLTLIAAALGWISLPGRFVESMIAGSIVFVCIENVVRPDPPRRWILSFGFGLVHGIGFASMLRPLLPPSGAVLPLLAFNVGVELGQMAIVVALFPLLHLAAKLAGPARYRGVVALAGSAAIGAFGMLMLVERVFGLHFTGM